MCPVISSSDRPSSYLFWVSGSRLGLLSVSIGSSAAISDLQFTSSLYHKVTNWNYRKFSAELCQERLSVSVLCV